MVKEQNQTEEVNGKTERSGEEKVSALTLSLHPGELIFGFFCVFTKQLHVKSVSYHLLLGSSCSAGVIKLCLAEAGVPDGQWQGTVKLLPAHCFSKSKDFFFFFLHLTSGDSSVFVSHLCQQQRLKAAQMSRSTCSIRQQRRVSRAPRGRGHLWTLEVMKTWTLTVSKPSLHVYPPHVIHIEKSQCQDRFNPSPFFKYTLEMFLLYLQQASSRRRRSRSQWELRTRAAT